MNNNSTPVRILQLTDTHLFADRHGLLHGVNTRESLQRVLQTTAQRPRADLVLVTGDLVHDESAEGYRALSRMLKPIKAPVGVIAGNHDSIKSLRAVMPKAVRLGGVYRIQNWRIVLLNTQIPGKPGGHLDSAELYFLEAALVAAANCHVLVAQHHPPVPVGSAWLDRIGLDNPGDLFAVLDRFSNVRGVVCGHVHQEFDARREGMRLLATPSTCVQFKPGSREFSVDHEPPGMRWLTLHADGSIETEVERVSRQNAH